MSFRFSGTDVDLATVVIEAGRLRLDPLTELDTRAIFESFTPTITRYMVPKVPEHIGETEAFVAAAIRGLEERTDLHLVIRGRANNEFLGICALHDRAEPELGIWLKIAAHGRGYGREAIAMLIDWARAHVVFERLLYPVDRRNAPSVRIPESLGGKIIGARKQVSQSGRELDEVIYAIGRDHPMSTS